MKKILILLFILSLTHDSHSIDMKDEDSYELNIIKSEGLLSIPLKTKETLSTRIIELINTCWLNEVTEPDYTKKIQQFRIGDYWENIQKEDHIFVKFTKPLKLDNYVGGMEISEILINNNLEIILSRNKDVFIRYSKCDLLPYLNIVCMNEVKIPPPAIHL